ncbi:crossover junction endodeoxyribonuclease RuvC [Entomospira entomophila]|uniref:Crossover junction endodeoxyribonuclease RuvC n=1 Tax=Entomospira entomophila TaxID=2719988 RepID=A0A968KRI8_9SPIO|nr:crossover junction endodeoxyribonuclease RuvC [Entomospira entomophilus]NIZ40798.1 crossover junction endodeoxyribonuclease RuvC [Entomospira entomophilus]WDI35010.1 crossover junction endodeoxyribonuclease RuvC [Entomospira entomophilus]
MRILGVDPGLKNIGWGVIDSTSHQRLLKYLGHGVIETSSSWKLADRLKHLHDEFIKIITEYEPTMLANEALLFQKNVSSALPVAHARGVILCLSAVHQLEIKSFAPNTIKQAVTGNGHATKSDIQQMVKILLKLHIVPQSDHAADALACAITAAYGTPCVSDKLT